MIKTPVDGIELLDSDEFYSIMFLLFYILHWVKRKYCKARNYYRILDQIPSLDWAGEKIKQLLGISCLGWNSLDMRKYPFQECNKWSNIYFQFNRRKKKLNYSFRFIWIRVFLFAEQSIMFSLQRTYFKLIYCYILCFYGTATVDRARWVDSSSGRTVTFVGSSVLFLRFPKLKSKFSKITTGDSMPKVNRILNKTATTKSPKYLKSWKTKIDFFSYNHIFLQSRYDFSICKRTIARKEK